MNSHVPKIAPGSTSFAPASISSFVNALGRVFSRRPNLAEGAKKAEELGPPAMYRGSDSLAGQAPQKLVGPPSSAALETILSRGPLKKKVSEAIEEKDGEPDGLAPIGRPIGGPLERAELELDGLDALAQAPVKLCAVQERNLTQLILRQHNSYICAAKQSPHGKLLINRYTAEGKQLIELCNGRSFQAVFNVHSIIFDGKGKIFIRAPGKAFASSKHKKIFSAIEYRTKKEYAWTVIKEYQFHMFEQPIMQEFARFLEENPDLAFTPVPRILQYPYPKGQENLRGVTLAKRYQGDACDCGNNEQASVLFAESILRLVDSLNELHKGNFVHRDIKLENILLDQEGKAFFHDHECLWRADQPVAEVLGTVGYISWEYALTGVFQTIVAKQDLRKNDIFALAVSLYQDLQPDIKGGVCAEDRDDFVNYFRLRLGWIGDSTPVEQNEVLEEWLLQKQQQHEASAPKDDGKPYLAYRQLLWKAMSPVFDERPDTEAFKKDIETLYEQGLLPLKSQWLAPPQELKQP